MLRAAEITGVKTYEDVVGKAFGRPGRMFALAAMAVSVFTANCSHMKFIAGTFIKLEGDGGGFLRTVAGDSQPMQQLLAMGLFGGIVLPLCFKQRLSELRHVSLVVVVYCIALSLVFVGKAIQICQTDGLKNTHRLAKVHTVGEVFDVAPVAAFGFSIIAEVFSVYAEANEPEKIGRCAHVATALVTCVYLVVGLLGSLAFADPGSNILLNFPGDRFMALLSLGLVIIITLLYPVINFPTVQAVAALISGNDKTPSPAMRRNISIVGLALVMLLDTAIVDMSFVFGLCGSLGLGFLAYVLPCASFLAITKARGGLVADKIIAVVIGLLGLVMAFGSTGRIVQGMISQ
jgi:amino acid permease